MIKDIRRLLNDYVNWLKDKTTLRQINEQWVEITTPYLDRHNDYLQIYAKRNNGGFLLTDDGYTIRDLELSGCELKTSKRKALLEMTLNGFGIKYNDSALEIRASESNFAIQKHNLLQAMLAVNDLFCLAQPRVESIFLEDVASWLGQNEIRFIQDVKFTGNSGFDHRFNFAIPKSLSQPDRIIQAINKPDRIAAERVAFSWLDTREARVIQSPDMLAYAFLNDLEHQTLSDVEDCLRNYDVVPVLWRKREDVREELRA